MAVARSDFAATLLNKLKLEDPWLPPSSWESIPSESGPRVARPAPSSDHRPLRRASSVSEASLVRLAMNALQGVESALISIEKISTAFCSDPADRTFHQIPSLWNRASSTHAQGKILKSIGCSGFLVFLLRRFVDYFTNSNIDDDFVRMRQHENPELAEVQDPRDGKVQQEEHPPYSLVNHAFSVAVGKIIEGYICALDTMYASVHLRHSSESAQVPLEVCSSVGCLTTVIHSEITLLELYLHTKEVRTHIEALGNICNLSAIAFCFSKSSFEDLITKAMLEFRNFCRGGDLLTYLYAQLQVADPPHRAVLKFLFLRSFEPYYGFIRSWMYKAEISDPYKEFIVEQTDNFPFHHHGKADMSHDYPLASIRERDEVSVPCFLRDYLIPIVRAGQQLQVLMKLLEICTFVASKDLTYEDLLPCPNGFSINHAANACPITFNREEIEAKVLARANYYKRMHEKLESLMTKLEFRYQQVVSHDIAPNSFGHGLKNSNDLASFKLDNCLVADSAEDKRAGDGISSEDSSTRDDLYYTANAYEPSECSSSTDSEEKFQSEQLVDLSSYKAALEEKYLSALSFSVNPTFENSLEKPYESEIHNVESDLDGVCGGKVGAFNCQKSYESAMFWDQISMNNQAEKPNWPANGSWKRFLSVDGSFRDNSRSNLLDSEEKVRTMGASEEGISCYRKMIAVNDVLQEELFGRDQQENNTPSLDLFNLKDWKITCHNSFLSINPMLTKSTFIKLQTGLGESDRKCGHSLPYFDFSSVADPCRGSLRTFSSDCTGSRASAPNIMSDRADKKLCDQESLINRRKIHDVKPLPEPKDYNKEDATPCLVSGGSSWESLLGRSYNTVSTSAGDHSKSSLAKFEMPLDFIISKCLQQEIMLQYKYVSRLIIKLLEEGFDFKEHLLALRRYHFMELADWADLFILSLSNHKWCITEAEQRLAEIQGFLELSIQRSSCEFDPNKNRLYVYMKGHDTMPLTTSSIGLHSFDFLGLGYRVDWPVSIVLTSGALRIYSEIFSFLIKLKLSIFSLTDVWRSLKELRPLISLNQCAEQHDQEKGHYNLLVKMRHQINHFVSTLQQYVESQLSHVSWCRFLHSLQHKVKDMMDLESVHMAYLIDSLHICFQSEETQHVARIIDRILQCAIDFRSCLKGGMWDVVINQGDPAGKLSRIKISQVFSIKNTFDKNLQDLRIYYLTSPKHGECRLSRFWGYLNYNEYYSDVSNEVWRYSFSL